MKTFDVIHHPGDNLHVDIRKMSKGYQYVIIDAPPGISQVTYSILLSSNLAIVPVEPSPLSDWTGSTIVSLIKESQKYNDRLEGRLLVSRKVVGTAVGRRAREFLEAYGPGLLDAEICQRTDYVKSLIEGVSVMQYAAGREAAKEIKRLCDEILSISKTLDFQILYAKEVLSDIRRRIDEYRTGRPEKRFHPRKTPLIVVDFVVENRAYGGFIHNISDGGALIETRESFSAGQDITLTFTSPCNQRHIKLTGEIVRVDPEGIGVMFKSAL